jgi:acid phosphatase
MRSPALCIGSVLLFLLFGCAAKPPPAATPPSPGGARASVPNLWDTQRAITEYIDSGRYDREVARIAYEAQEFLEMRAGQVTKPAIVLDVDETTLSNWPAYRVNGWARILNGGCDLRQGPCGLRAWQSMGQAAALKPMLAMAQRAHGLGVAVFFLSARPAELHDVTEQNLRAVGYPIDGVIVYPPGAHFSGAQEFKAPQRQRLTEQGYSIILSASDQASDLAGGFAERTFKLPNPVYLAP